MFSIVIRLFSLSLHALRAFTLYYTRPAFHRAPHHCAAARSRAGGCLRCRCAAHVRTFNAAADGRRLVSPRLFATDVRSTRHTRDGSVVLRARCRRAKHCPHTDLPTYATPRATYTPHAVPFAHARTATRSAYAGSGLRRPPLRHCGPPPQPPTPPHHTTPTTPTTSLPAFPLPHH